MHETATCELNSNTCRVQKTSTMKDELRTRPNLPLEVWRRAASLHWGVSGGGRERGLAGFAIVKFSMNDLSGQIPW